MKRGLNFKVRKLRSSSGVIAEWYERYDCIVINVAVPGKRSARLSLPRRALADWIERTGG